MKYAGTVVILKSGSLSNTHTKKKVYNFFLLLGGLQAIFRLVNSKH